MRILDSCYIVNTDDITWDDGQTYCTNIGGHLAIITNQLEQYSIILAINSSETRGTWIGCYYDVLTMSWTWVNGEAMSYSNFLNDNVSPSTSFAVVIMGISYSLERKWKTRDKNASKRSNIVQIVHILAFNKALTILNIN